MRKLLLVIFLTVATMSRAQFHQQQTLSDNWQFSKDGVGWKTVYVPHDWAISGPFDKKWDLQNVAIEQNGETEKTEKSGRSGALPWIGEGHYRRSVTLPQGFRHAELLFDGAMSQPHVKVNGHDAGHWAYGYNAFRVDITPWGKAGENLVEVDLTNEEESSRWYPGAGLYRPVELFVTTDEAYLDPWNTYIRTLAADSTQALVQVDAAFMAQPGETTLRFTIFDANGQCVANQLKPDWNRDGVAGLVLRVSNPQLWSPETPYIYKVKTELLKADGSRVIDSRTEKFGIRTISVGKDNGFALNGKTRKLKGVCLHHDLGPLGAAVNRAALIRQIRIMKEMGADAIRTAHNMPSTWQMEICDSMGMMVMAESFDMWRYPKCKNGYAKYFDEWADRDIENLILRHRNHPSIVMWSIGNEIPEQWSEEGRALAAHLQDLCHRLDPSRPVTQGLDKAEDALNSGMAQLMDVPGFNYRVHKYEKNYSQLPQGFLLGSETASTVSSRGVYKFPVEVSDSKSYADGQCSSYDTEYCSWSNLPDDDWVWQDDKSWVIGEFVWTGFDYLGEPTPYDEYWPSRSSYFGICDLAGLPKDRYWLYRSRWNTQEETVHLLPHWTWNARKGQVTPVYCYTSYPSAELFVNGKSQGRITKKSEERLDRYRLRWNNVRYEPGEIKVICYDKQNRPVAEKTIKTAGKASKLQLDADRTLLNADGNDLSFITVSMTDAEGTLVPDCQDELTFEVTGTGLFRGVCNGDATSLEPFTKPKMRLFNGQLVLVVQSTCQAGEIKVVVKDAAMHVRKTLVLKTKTI